jgi:hypothetical protein
MGHGLHLLVHIELVTGTVLLSFVILKTRKVQKASPAGGRLWSEKHENNLIHGEYRLLAHHAMYSDISEEHTASIFRVKE